jgi:hypothetical protein
MSLAAGQGAGVAAKEGQVRSKFLAKGHKWVFSLEITIGAVFGGAWILLQPWKDSDGPTGLPQRSKAQLEQSTGHLVSVAGPGKSCKADNFRAAPVCVCIGTGHRARSSRCVGKRDLYDARLIARARGDEELSAKERSEREGARHPKHSKKSTTPGGVGKGGGRSGDLGRALRSVYDDTLRETVPDEFLRLIGKLD